MAAAEKKEYNIMTKVKIDPGVCGFVTEVEASLSENEDEEDQVNIKIRSGCKAVMGLAHEVCNEPLDSFTVCLGQPGTGPLYKYAATHFPGHCSCIVIAGIVKAVEAECHLALKKDASITYDEE